LISFLQPAALFALVAATIPALLHLLGRRIPPTVSFPAVRYLTATEKEHSRHLRLRNMLLLILRTAGIALLVLAASRPAVETGSGESHMPTAWAIVVDNSASSSAVVEGRRVLDELVTVARDVLSRFSDGDRLWLTLADGTPRQVSRLEAKAALDALAPSAIRLDLGAATRAAALSIQNEPLVHGPVVIVSDLQASALSQGTRSNTRIIAWQPNSPPANRWLDSIISEPEQWSPNGAVVVSVLGSEDRQGALRLRVGGTELSRAVASPGERAILRGTLTRRGWTRAVVELDPDELRIDDRREIALFYSDPASVRLASGLGEFLNDAFAVLLDGNRISRGNQITLGELSAEGVSIVFPPADPALTGAINRELRALGVNWQYEQLMEGEWILPEDIGPAAGIEVYRRHALRGSGQVYGTVSEEPWLVRDGNVVVVASRMEPEWTRLPVSAAFLPLLDLVINRIAAEETWLVKASPGDLVDLPKSASVLFGAAEEQPVTVPPIGRLMAPLHPGVYFLGGVSGDTVGALEVFVDPRESRLATADESDLRGSLGDRAEILTTGEIGRELFRDEGRTEIANLLLILAAIALLAEFLVASSGGRARKAG